MFRFINLVVFLVISFTCENDSAKILAVYPTPSISHQVVFRPLTQELAKRGHEVVVITTDPIFPKGQAPRNLSEIDVHDMAYPIWIEGTTNMILNNKLTTPDHLIELHNIMDVIMEKIFEVDEVKDIIENQHDNFDLLIVEAGARLALGFSHAIKVPVIQFSSLGPLVDQMAVVGASYHPVLPIYPQAPHRKTHNMSTWEKLLLYYDDFWLLRQYYQSELYENEVLKNVFGLDTPTIKELQNNVDMLFLNVHYVWEGNRPVPPGVVYVPGLHEKEQKDLPKDIQTYLDSSVHGVIYISFGTNINPSFLPAIKIQELIKAFSELPYDVLWKWNDEELPGRAENIRISKWLPQSDLLRHPNVKLFITQGGLQSTEEAITAAVPLIGIPMAADQWFNVDKYVYHKIGLKVLLEDIEAEPFKNAIKTVIDDKSYRENIVRLRNIMHDQPMSSLERAVWWTEHVLRHGGARHLRVPAANMPWTQYYEIELVLIVLSIFSVAIGLTFFVVYKVFKATTSKRESKKVKSS